MKIPAISVNEQLDIADIKMLIVEVSVKNDNSSSWERILLVIADKSINIIIIMVHI